MKILVVEDNEGDYFLVHEYLHEIFSGIEIKHNTLLQDAIHSLENNSFDIILLDLSLPDSNGIGRMGRGIAGALIRAWKLNPR